MEIITNFINIFLHLDKSLGGVITQYGTITYLLLFIILFCETGLVVTPILPGDSLIFAAASFGALGQLNIFILIPLVLVAAILGDATNYMIGAKIGKKLIESNNRFIKKEYLEKTHKFYEKYGGKTIIIARFVPIVRTFAPFVAGVGEMHYKTFFKYNAAGATLWAVVVLGAGYFLGSVQFVKDNFTIVVFAIIFISVLPAIIGVLKEKSKKKLTDEETTI